MLDAWIMFNDDMCIQSIQSCNASFEKQFEKSWQCYIGKTLSKITDFQLNEQRKKLFWHENCFEYFDFIITNQIHCLLLRKQSIDIRVEQDLYQHAFDQILDGIQVYDKNACLVYINKASREISNIPEHIDVKGKHLFDLYDVDSEFSTVMTCLRTSAPVINRLDDFKATNGKNIISVNTAYPIFKKKELMGVVEFDLNLHTINRQIERLESIKTTIDKIPPKKYLSRYNGYHFSDLIGHNEKLVETISLAKKIAPQECNVLIVGETGTGKEIFAQSIHKISGRRKKKFFAINCSAIPESLIESTFFGTSKGAFTGSVEKAGLLEEINGGTLFLDELNSMSLSMQSKLLRLIQEGVFHRVGGTQDIQVDIRFISSCNEEVSKLIEKNIIRSDLYYRLSTIILDIPTLRERTDDIQILIEFYLQKNTSKYAKSIDGISPLSLTLLREYHWPGNVRELFNVLDYVLNTIEEDEQKIEIKHLPNYLQRLTRGTESDQIFSNYTILSKCSSIQSPPIDFSYQTTTEQSNLLQILEEVEQQVIENTLKKFHYNISHSAKSLGLSRQRLQYRIKRLKIDEKLEMIVFKNLCNFSKQ